MCISKMRVKKKYIFDVEIKSFAPLIYFHEKYQNRTEEIMLLVTSNEQEDFVVFTFVNSLKKDMEKYEKF